MSSDIRKFRSGYTWNLRPDWDSKKKVSEPLKSMNFLMETMIWEAINEVPMGPSITIVPILGLGKNRRNRGSGGLVTPFQFSTDYVAPLG